MPKSTEELYDELTTILADACAMPTVDMDDPRIYGDIVSPEEQAFTKADDDGESVCWTEFTTPVQMADILLACTPEERAELDELTKTIRQAE